MAMLNNQRVYPFNVLRCSQNWFKGNYTGNRRTTNKAPLVITSRYGNPVVSFNLKSTPEAWPLK